MERYDGIPDDGKGQFFGDVSPGVVESVSNRRGFYEDAGSCLWRDARNPTFFKIGSYIWSPGGPKGRSECEDLPPAPVDLGNLARSSGSGLKIDTRKRFRQHAPRKRR